MSEDLNMNDKRTQTTYSREYSERSFWKKVAKCASCAGLITIEKALVLYYCLQDPDTPAWAKAVIVGALGYFILPMDLIPDFTPGVGYADDLGALAGAAGTVFVHIKPEHEAQAKEKLAQWFGTAE